MGVIKSNNVPASVTPFSMADIEAHARSLLLRARQQADQALAAAQAEGAIIRQNAYDQGFAAGREDGLKKGTEEGRAAGKQAALAEQKAKLEQLVKSMLDLVNAFEASRTRFESSAAAEVIKLSVAIARRVTKLQGALDPNVMTENVLAAMKLAVHSTDVRIAIHPQQKQTLVELLPQLRLQWPTVKHVELVEDASLSPGSCRVMSGHAEIDGELDRQIDRVAADLLPQQGTDAR